METETGKSGFESSTLAERNYCEEDVDRLCWKRNNDNNKNGREFKRWSDVVFKKTLGSQSEDKNLTSTECLEQQADQIQSEKCNFFIQSRKTCLNDLLQLPECSDFLPHIEVEDRYLMRKQRLDSRKARLELRRKMHGEEMRSSSSSSKSKSKSKTEEKKKESDQQQQQQEASPSMSLSDELLSEDEKQHLQRTQELKERFEQDKKEAQLSSKRADTFMTLCSALMTEEESKSKLSEECKKSPVVELLPFGNEHHAKNAKRKKGVRAQIQKKFARAEEKHKKRLDKLKDHVTRHALDKLDGEIDAGKTELSETEETERGRFLLQERKQRELRKRRNLQKQQMRHNNNDKNGEHLESSAEFTKGSLSGGGGGGASKGTYTIDEKTGKKIYDDPRRQQREEEAEHSASVSEKMKREAEQM